MQDQLEALAQEEIPEPPQNREPQQTQASALDALANEDIPKPPKASVEIRQLSPEESASREAEIMSPREKTSQEFEEKIAENYKLVPSVSRYPETKSLADPFLVGQVALDTMAVPAKVVAGAAARLIAPELIEASRERVKDDIGVKKLFNEIAPDIFMGDVISKYTDPFIDKGVKKSITAFDVQDEKYKTAIQAAGDVAKIATNIGASVLGDPLSHFSVFTHVPGAKVLNNGEIALNDYVKVAVSKDGNILVKPITNISDYAPALTWNPMVPFKGTLKKLPGGAFLEPKVLIEGSALKKAAIQTELSLAANSPEMIRGLLLNTGSPEYEAMKQALTLKGFLSKSEIEDFVTSLADNFDLSERGFKILNTFAEFPTKGEALLAQKGITLQPGEKERAFYVLKAFKEKEQQIVKRIRDAGGVIDEFVPKAKIDGSKYERDEFSLSESRGFSRRLTKEAEQARNDFLNKKLKEADQEAQNMSRNFSRMSPVPDSYNERMKLSTEAATEWFRDTYGFKGKVFEENPFKVIGDQLYDLSKKADVLEHLNGVISLGKTEQGWEDLILAAKAKGSSANIEDIFVSKFGRVSQDLDGTPRVKLKQNLVPLDKRTINTWVKYTGKDQSYISQLRFPKAIAENVKFAMEGLNGSEYGVKAIATALAAQKMVTQAILTNPERFGREFVENSIRYASARGELKHLASAIADRFKSEPDEITKIAKQLDSIYSMDDVKSLSIKAAKDPKSWRSVGEFFQTLKDMGKDGLRLFSPLPMSTTIKGVRLPGNPIFEKVRMYSNEMSTLFKSAYMRQLVSEGATVSQATEQAQKVFLDFSKNSNQLSALRAVNPFAGYFIKNLESVFNIAKANPGSINLTNPYDGFIKRAIEKYAGSGVNPDQAAVLQQNVPYPVTPIQGTFIKGADDIIANREGLNKLFNKMALAAGAKDGESIIWNMPSHTSAAFDLVDPKKNRVREFAGPTARAIGALLGYDIYKDKDLPYSGTSQGTVEQLTKVADELNPLGYKNLMKSVVRPSIQKLIPEYAETLRNHGLSPQAINIAERILGTKIQMTNEQAQAKFGLYTLGLGRLDKTFQNHFFAQASISKQLYRDINEAINTFNKSGRSTEFELLRKTISERIKKFNSNAQFNEEFTQMMSGVPVESEYEFVPDEISQQILQKKAAELEAMQQQILEKEDNLEDEVDREPQSTQNPNYNRDLGKEIAYRVPGQPFRSNGLGFVPDEKYRQRFFEEGRKFRIPDQQIDEAYRSLFQFMPTDPKETKNPSRAPAAN